jgi:hypothetical protein
MNKTLAVRHCADALAILDAVLAEDPTPETVRDLLAAAGLLEEALEELEPSGLVAGLFLGVPV